MGGLQGVSCWPSHSIRSEIADKRRRSRRLLLRCPAGAVTDSDLFCLRRISIFSGAPRMFFLWTIKKTESSATAEIGLQPVGRWSLRRSRSSKVTNISTNRKLVCTFLLISRTRFQLLRSISQINSFDRGASFNALFLGVNL